VKDRTLMKKKDIELDLKILRLVKDSGGRFFKHSGQWMRAERLYDHKFLDREQTVSKMIYQKDGSVLQKDARMEGACEALLMRGAGCRRVRGSSVMWTWPTHECAYRSIMPIGTCRWSWYWCGSKVSGSGGSSPSEVGMRAAPCASFRLLILHCRRSRLLYLRRVR